MEITTMNQSAVCAMSVRPRTAGTILLTGNATTVQGRTVPFAGFGVRTALRTDDIRFFADKVVVDAPTHPIDVARSRLGRPPV